MRKKLLWGGAVLIATGVVITILVWSTLDQEERPRNALTSKEIADGWVLLFDGETTEGWNIEGDVKVREGLMVLGDTQAASATSTKSFEDFELRFDYRFEMGQEGLLKMEKRG